MRQKVFMCEKLASYNLCSVPTRACVSGATVSFENPAALAGTGLYGPRNDLLTSL